MSQPSPPRRPSRRDLLTGRAVGELAADRLAGAVATADRSFEAGSTVRLATRAMACEFAVALAGGKRREMPHASDALDLVHHLEQVMSVYRDDSELSVVNRRATEEPTAVSNDLAPVVGAALGLSVLTGGAFDPTSAPLVALWRRAKADRRLPTEAETDAAVARRGVEEVAFESGPTATVAYAKPGLSLDLGAIGKGYAIDRAVSHLEACGVDDFLLHGGLSSVAARGASGANDGWPVGIGDPLRPNRRLATVMLRDAALSTSGANTQFFRIGREKFGHILDPRTGRPADGLLSVTVVAPNATVADALSTAFYVMGLEKSVTFCNTYMGIGCILVPPPGPSGRLSPVVGGLDPTHLRWSDGPTSDRSGR